MHEVFYSELLYPLMDRALKAVDSCGTPFYLTGGTALSRFYFNHRYSDDLDFFVNQDSDYKSYVDKIFDYLKHNFDYDKKELIQLESYSKIHLMIDEKSYLKLDLVNDVGFHANGFSSFDLFSKVVGLENLLANKIAALLRNASKDFADLYFLCKNYSFNWEDAYKNAFEKDTWVNELLVSEIISEFDISRLNEIRWIHPFDLTNIINEFVQMADDLAFRKNNSLCKI